MTGIYFSGTGNSKFCLSRFLDGVSDNLPMYSIEDASALSAIREDTELVFAYPVYYSNLPKIVRDFIEDNRDLWRGKRIYIIATMGLFSGDGSGVAARLFAKYGASITGGLHLRMPDCIGDVAALKKSFSENKRIVDASCAKIELAAAQYKAGTPTRDGLSFFSRLAGLFGQRLYFRGKTKDYTENPKIDTAKCIGCGLCENVCPMQNIQIKANKAVAGNRCTLCYRCFTGCPGQAITLIGKRVLEQHHIEPYISSEKCDTL